MVLTVLMFGGTRLMAQNENNAVNPQTTPTEENLESNNEGEKGASLVEEGKNTDIDSNEAEAKEDAGKTESTEAEANKNTNTEVSEPKANEDAPKAKQEEKKTEAKEAEKPAAKEAEKPAEKQAEKPVETPDVKAAEKTAAGNGPEDGAKPQAAPAKAPEAQGTPAGEGNGEGTGTGKGNDPKTPAPPTPEVDTSKDEELKALQDQINAEQDQKKKADLQKKYNEKYLEKVEAAGADKTDPNIQERLTKDEDIKNYNIIKAKQEELKQKKEALEKKIAEGKASEEDIEAFKKSIEEYNNLLGAFKPPRALTDEEARIKSEISAKPYINIDKDKSSNYGKDQYEKYLAAKEKLMKALDPKKDGLTEADYKELREKGIKVNNLADLEKEFLALNDEVLRLIKSTNDKEKIVPKFTNEDGSPKIDIFPYDFTGSIDLGKNLNKEGEDYYYLPDGTPLKLFVQVGRDNPEKGKEATEITFTLTPKKIGNPTGGDASPDTQVIVLNGEPIELSKDKNGNYTFTTKQAFGVGQFKIDMSSMYGELHEGFTLTMEATGDGKTTKVEKNFLITKKGYDENPETGNIGNTDKEKPQKEDPGKIEDGKVSDYTEKVFDIFALLKKSNGYIDKVLVNSVNGKALPLSHVKITMNIPKNSDGKFAEYIHKSDLKYEDQGNGVYVLELERKEFENNLVEENGKFYLKNKDGEKGTELTKADDLNNAVLEGKDGKTYVDSNGDVHEGVKTVEVNDGKANDTEETEYRLIGDQLSKKSC